MEEMAAGRNFAGAAGFTYNRMLSLVGIERSNVMTSNTIWCKPLRLKWMDFPERFRDAEAAITHCRPNLDGLIERAQPKVIVPMGNVALRRICGVSGIESHAGYVMATPYGIPAVPTFHPAFIQRGQQKLNASAVFALNRARSIAQGTYQESKYDLLLDPPPDRVRDYIRSGQSIHGEHGGRIPTLVVDIETPESDRLDEEEIEQEGASWTIVRAGFSVRRGSAVTFPWQPPYIGLLQEALDLSEEVIEHADNNFDSRRLRHAGLRLPARIVSSMWAWHFLESDLRKGLGAVAPFYYAGPPWKSQSAARPAFYNAMDNAVTMDVYCGTRDTLIAQSRWAAFERHCIRMDEPLRVMGERGLLVDPVYQAAFMDRLDQEWEAANADLQQLVPDSIKKRKYWKRAPKDLTGVTEIV
jgi:uracil-DNA glycosylase family 4